MADRKVKVLVSGTYDVIHAGHVQFLREAKALGDHLTVVVPTDDVVKQIKGREPCLPASHKKLILLSIDFVDSVVIGGSDWAPETNFELTMRSGDFDILAATVDDKYVSQKKELCAKLGVKYVQIPKTPVPDSVSSTDLRIKMAAPDRCPARVDLAGGWLDVPRLARDDGCIVNCAITSMMSLDKPVYKPGGGVGGSAAWALLQGKDPVAAELRSGVGWQDPAVIKETGLCSWRSGAYPVLVLKRNPEMLNGRMLLEWTGKPHCTVDLVDTPRDYDKLVEAGARAHAGVADNNLHLLAEGVALTHEMQLDEGMAPLTSMPGQICHRYCGSGWGGYVLRIFYDKASRDQAVEQRPDLIAVEPYIKDWA